MEAGKRIKVGEYEPKVGDYVFLITKGDMVNEDLSMNAPDFVKIRAVGEVLAVNSCMWDGAGQSPAHDDPFFRAYMVKRDKIVQMKYLGTDKYSAELEFKKYMTAYNVRRYMMVDKTLDEVRKAIEPLYEKWKN